MRATSIGCFGAHPHGLQVTSLLCSSGDYLSVFRDLKELILKEKNSVEQEKESIFRMRVE